MDCSIGGGIQQQNQFYPQHQQPNGQDQFYQQQQQQFGQNNSSYPQQQQMNQFPSQFNQQPMQQQMGQNQFYQQQMMGQQNLQNGQFQQQPLQQSAQQYNQFNQQQFGQNQDFNMPQHQQFGQNLISNQPLHQFGQNQQQFNSGQFQNFQNNQQQFTNQQQYPFGQYQSNPPPFQPNRQPNPDHFQHNYGQIINQSDQIIQIPSEAEGSSLIEEQEDIPPVFLMQAAPGQQVFLPDEPELTDEEKQLPQQQQEELLKNKRYEGRRQFFIDKLHMYLGVQQVGNRQKFPDEDKWRPQRTFELLNALYFAMQAAMAEIIRACENRDVNTEISTIIPNFNPYTNEEMGQLYDKELSWAYEILEADSKTVRTTLNTLDNIAVEQYIEFRKLKPYYSPKLHLQHFVVDVEKMIVVYPDKDFEYKLQRSKDNNRARPEGNGAGVKHSDEIRFVEETFDSYIGKFSHKWKEEKNKEKFPTPNQIFNGIRKYQISELKKARLRQGGRSNPQLESLYIDCINKMREELKFVKELADEPCNTMWHNDLDLNDPNSKIVQAVMKIYSMEPPIYGELNKICRKEMEDITDEDLEYFGPYASALCAAINAEQWRHDKIEKGEKYFDLPNKIDNHKLGFFNKSFLLFRGVNFLPEDFDQWTKQKGKLRMGNISLKYDEPDTICIRGYSSCSDDFLIARNFAEKYMEKGKIPIVLVFLVMNHKGYTGFRLNRKCYSEHSYEKEVLLQEGFRVYVVGHDKTNHPLTRRSNQDQNVILHQDKLRLIYLVNLEEAMI